MINLLYSYSNILVFVIAICLWNNLTKASTPNILVITVDDMNCDSVGIFGGAIKDLTPNIDKLASQGIRFNMAHVQVANCNPSRNVMFSGRYPHNSGIEGFYPIKNDFPVFSDIMRESGYFVAIRGKVNHSTPYHPYTWDADLTIDENGNQLHKKDTKSYGNCLLRGIKMANSRGRKFAININISDPHKPFWSKADNYLASKVYPVEESPIPGFLFEDHIVRRELRRYYVSVRRADDAVGSILDALDESGKAQDTIVLFLSDHGMPFPFAKTELYHHSTRTPLIIRWPTVVQQGMIDNDHMVSAIDILPTLCEIVGNCIRNDMQGESFLPLLRGEKQNNRNVVFKEYNENARGKRNPMRAIQTPKFLYIFNLWSDGKKVMVSASHDSATYRRMCDLAKTSETIKDRLYFYKYRTKEELYDVIEDPNCLINLYDSNEHRQILNDLKCKLKMWMKTTNDPILPQYIKQCSL